MSLRLEAAIHGKLKEFMAAQAEAAKIAVTDGVRDAGTRIKLELRDQVNAAGLGKGVGNAWRMALFPNGRPSLNAAAYIKTKVPNIIYAFNYGVTIKSAKGIFLAIPTAEAPKRGSDGKPIHPATFPKNLGTLRLIYRPGKLSFYVIDNVRLGMGKRGGIRNLSQRALRTGAGNTTVVMFILVPQVRLRKRLDIESVANKWGLQTPQLVLDHWPEVKEIT